MNAQSAGLPANRVGLGFRTAHIDQIINELPDVPWFEVLLENHSAKGGLVPRQLAAVREHYPLSLHSVGMSLGGVEPLDMDYLATIKRMVKMFQPLQISDHLCFTHYGNHYFNDLLPIPFTSESLRHVCNRIAVVQDFLDSRILVENLSSYLQFEASEMNEAEFINELVAHTGCGILLDINNAYVNEFNHGCSARAFIDTICFEHVGEVHLAGYEDRTDFLIDAHNNRISDAVWALFEYYARQSTGAPVLIEWDNDIPALDVLLSEAIKARCVIAESTDSEFTDATC
ncbi:MAG: DUF692 domain-containing protein [Gammaproteobacteria bacterium]|nr:DUF692 domain-containing protein [Gammaproteobacteria bacterium]